VRGRAESRGGGGGFLAGFLLGGTLFGALGFLFAPQISAALLTDEQRLKLPRFLAEEEAKDPEQTKQARPAAWGTQCGRAEGGSATYCPPQVVRQELQGRGREKGRARRSHASKVHAGTETEQDCEHCDVGFEHCTECGLQSRMCEVFNCGAVWHQVCRLWACMGHTSACGRAQPSHASARWRGSGLADTAVRGAVVSSYLPSPPHRNMRLSEGQLPVCERT